MHKILASLRRAVGHEAPFDRVLEEARNQGVRLTSEQVEELHEAFCRRVRPGRLHAGQSATVPATPAPPEPKATGVSFARTTLSALAGPDRRLQRNEISTAVGVVRAYLESRGAGEEAAIRARKIIMTELGARVGGQTVHEVDGERVVTLAASFGDPLEAHAAIYQQHMRDRLFRETRMLALSWVRSSSAPDPVLESSLKNAEEWPALVDIVGGRTELMDYLGAHAQEPFATAFAKVASMSTEERLRGLQALGELRVAIADANASGLPDADDLMIIEVGDAPVMRTLGEEADRLRTARAMQEAAYDMVNEWGESKFRFGGFPPEFNTALFELDGQCFVLREGQSASAALRDLLENPSKYTFDCATALVALWHVGQYRMYQERYGEEADAHFDAYFAGMRIGPWQYGPQLQLLPVEANVEADSPLPGESRYFVTWDVDIRGQMDGWSGENVVYVGKAKKDDPKWEEGEDLYFGHPFGLTTANNIIRHLNEARWGINHLGLPEIEEAHQELMRLEVPAPYVEKVDECREALEEIISRVREGSRQAEQLRLTWWLNRDKIRALEELVGRQRLQAEAAGWTSAMEELEIAKQEINDADGRLDLWDLRTRISVMTAKNEALEQIKQLRKASRDVSASPILAVLTKVYAALEGLEPTDSSLFDTAFQPGPADSKAWSEKVKEAQAEASNDSLNAFFSVNK